MKKMIATILSIIILCSCASSAWGPISFPDHDNIQMSEPVRGERIVIFYSSNWCHWCGVAKTFLENNKISFIEKDYSDLEERNRLKIFANEIGYNGTLEAVPIFVIEGNILVGYNPKKILCAIKRKQCKTMLFETWESPLKQ